jgi:hypothetical protein
MSLVVLLMVVELEFMARSAGLQDSFLFTSFYKINGLIKSNLIPKVFQSSRKDGIILNAASNSPCRGSPLFIHHPFKQVFVHLYLAFFYYLQFHIYRVLLQAVLRQKNIYIVWTAG